MRTQKRAADLILTIYAARGERSLRADVSKKKSSHIESCLEQKDRGGGNILQDARSWCAVCVAYIKSNNSQHSIQNSEYSIVFL